MCHDLYKLVEKICENFKYPGDSCKSSFVHIGQVPNVSGQSTDNTVLKLASLL